jgi:molybdopterin converting factor small subunit
MPTISIPAPLRAFTEGARELQVHGASVGDAVQFLTTQHPRLSAELLGTDGNLRRFVNIFVGSANIRDLGGMETPLAERDRLIIIPSIAGG